MDLGSLDADRVEQIFVRHGAVAVSLSDARDNPVLEPAPGETRLWEDTQISGLFPADADVEALCRDLVHSLGIRDLPPHRVTGLEDRPWEREWLRDFGPMRFGRRLWVCPGDSTPGQDDAVVVRLDPGLAFGTGTHATTALCLEWLDSLDLAGKSVMDFGCGSGILAIAALKLGARSATAVDTDPQAITATRTNAEHNGVAARLTALSAQGEAGSEFDIVVANILARPLVDLAEYIALRVKSGRRLALSGILWHQVDEVRAAYAGLIEFDRPAIREQGGQLWVRLDGRRIGG